MSDDIVNDDQLESTDLNSIDLSTLLTSTVTLPSSYSIGAVGSSYSNGSLYGNISLAGSNYSITAASPYNWGSIDTNHPTVQLGKTGIEVEESADIKIGSISLKTFIKSIEERLALLTPNPKLESEWEELKELGNRYRELEQQIKDKMKTWDILKSDGDTTSK